MGDLAKPMLVTDTLWHGFSYLVANGDCRVGQTPVPGHADLDGHGLGEEVPDSVRDLGHHHREADGQQEHPQHPPGLLPRLIRCRSQACKADNKKEKSKSWYSQKDYVVQVVKCWA